jgi:outer membrane protein assembly factor BamB
MFGNRKSHCAAVAAITAAITTTAQAQWPQWGGPHGNFKADVGKLADKWPADGPRRVWERKLGDGFSAVVVDSGVLYTMHRDGDKEVAVALKAADGGTIWQFPYDAPFDDEMQMEFGPGPHSTPLVTDKHVYFVGVTCKLHCLDKKSGKPVWAVDLAEKYNTPHLGRGYGASPIPYKNSIILPIGGDGAAVAAFDQSDGQVIWAKHDYQIAYASPLVIQVGGQDQLVMFLGKEVVGLDPSTGEPIWSHAHSTKFDANIATPTWDGKELLFLSSAYNGGARVLRLERDGEGAKVEELWFNRKVQIHHGTAIEHDGFIYCSIGSFGPAFIAGVDMQTGEMAWRERGFGKATCIFGDGKLILLDQDGKLILAKASPEGIDVLSQCDLLDRVAWTVPTLAGSTLYVRDRSRIMALDLADASGG